jgi:hypothetical protein
VNDVQTLNHDTHINVAAIPDSILPMMIAEATSFIIAQDARIEQAHRYAANLRAEQRRRAMKLA